MYNRLYAFGCSFTQYKWPTWADFLHAGGIATDYSNWGLPGGSNDFILHSVTECLSTHPVTPNDLFAIMWSQPYRLSDYNDEDGWDMPGNAYVYQKDRAKFLHEDKISLENQSYIVAVQRMLEAIGCDYIFTSMQPMDLKYEDVYNTAHLFKPSMQEFLGYTRPHEGWRETLPGDRHPSPTQHMRFAHSLCELDSDATQQMCNDAEDWIFNSDVSWRRQYIYHPQKIPTHRLPSVENYYNTGNGRLEHVDGIQFKSTK